jgi:hypothetical protein
LDRTPFNRVGFFDVALPWRWSGMNALRGDAFSDQGVKELSEQQVQRGIFYLGRGLSLQPNNPEARLALANFYAQGNYYEGVSRTVLPQLEFGFSAALVALFLQQAASVDDSGAIGEFVGQWRERPELTAKDRQLLSDWDYRTLMHLDRPEEALVSIDRPECQGDMWTNMRVGALIKLKRFDEALTLAEGIRREIPGMLPLSRRTQAMVLSAKGDLEELRRVLDSLIEEGNLAPEAWIFAVEQTAKGDLNEQSEIYLGGFFRRFGAQPAAVNGLLNRLMATENIIMARAAATLAKDWQELTPDQRAGMGLLYIGGDELSFLKADWPIGVEMAGPVESIGRLFQAVLEATNADANDSALRAILSANRYNIIVYTKLITGFAKRERWALVNVVAETGSRYFSHSLFFQNYREQAEGHLSEAVPDSRLNEALTELSQRYEEEDIPALRAQLVELVRAEKWDEVESIVPRVRRQRPVWLKEVEGALDDADARAAAGRRDVSARWGVGGVVHRPS